MHFETHYPSILHLSTWELILRRVSDEKIIVDYLRQRTSLKNTRSTFRVFSITQLRYPRGDVVWRSFQCRKDTRAWPNSENSRPVDLAKTRPTFLLRLLPQKSLETMPGFHHFDVNNCKFCRTQLCECATLVSDLQPIGVRQQGRAQNTQTHEQVHTLTMSVFF